MFKRIFAVAAAASLSVLGATAAAQAQAQPQARPAGHLHGVRVVNLHRAFEAQLGHTKVGKISGIVYARGHRPKAAANTAATCTEPACPVTWQGGTVQHTPHVYLLLWGPNWTDRSEPGASARYLENFFSGLGDGAGRQLVHDHLPVRGRHRRARVLRARCTRASSTTPARRRTTPAWTRSAPRRTRSPQNQGITDLNDAQIIVATQSGTCPQGFAGTGCTGGTLPRNECGYHSSSNQPFINLPYELDAGTNCDENFVNPTPGPTTGGASSVAPCTPARSPTRSRTAAGSTPTTGGEIGDKCAGSPAFDLTLTTLSTGPSPWRRCGATPPVACVQTGAVQDSIKITSPGTQTNNVGDTVNLPIVGSSTAGNPLAWSQTGLPAGLTISASTGTVTGTPTTPGTSSVTVTATDETGAKKSVAFNWTINTAVTGKPVKGDHGKCLDDFGGATTNGNKVDIWTCNNTASQQWTFVSGAAVGPRQVPGRLQPGRRRCQAGDLDLQRPRRPDLDAQVQRRIRAEAQRPVPDRPERLGDERHPGRDPHVPATSPTSTGPLP